MDGSPALTSCGGVVGLCVSVGVWWNERKGEFDVVCCGEGEGVAVICVCGVGGMCSFVDGGCCVWVDERDLDGLEKAWESAGKY